MSASLSKDFTVQKSQISGKPVKIYRPVTKFIPKKNPTPSDGSSMSVPCGRCLGCRLDYSKMWTIRMVNEMHFHEQNCFLTLTYSPENLPKNGTLVKKHLQDFIKRYRKHLSDTLPWSFQQDPKYPNDSTATTWQPHKIRFYACAEYGEKLSRPHYHILVFGHQFADKKYYRTINGNTLYTSPTLEKLWKYGFSSIGEATMQSAAYVSRYVTKKVSGAQADKYYMSAPDKWGEQHKILGEFSTQSLKPGIGEQFYRKYKNDIYPSDEIIHDGKYFPVPTYYDVLLERDDPQLFAQVKKNRIDNFEELKLDHPLEFSQKRLIQKEACKQAKIDLHLKRKYENDD